MALTLIRAETFLDRSDWPEGEWTAEPDRVEWRDEGTGFPCLAIRHPHNLNWCGYVGVPPGHPLHGVGVGDDERELPEEIEMAAHGGITFAAPCMEDHRPLRERVCHTPLEGEPDEVWWLGFDCAHVWDLIPAMEKLHASYGLTVPTGIDGEPLVFYKNLHFVSAVIEDLAHAASSVAP